MSSDPIPVPNLDLGIEREKVITKMLKADGVNNAEVIAPFLDPMKFEQHVLKVCNPEPIRHQLLRFIQRHSPETPVVRGEADGFNWKTGILTLAKETAKGEGMRALLTVAHECGHANQKRDWPWLPRWALKVPVIRLFLETNAWRRALRMLT